MSESDHHLTNMRQSLQFINFRFYLSSIMRRSCKWQGQPLYHIKSIPQTSCHSLKPITFAKLCDSLSRTISFCFI